jgi:hypothetical protein
MITYINKEYQFKQFHLWDLKKLRCRKKKILKSLDLQKGELHSLHKKKAIKF